MVDRFQRAAIIGVGLIGASFARALKEKGLASGVAGYDADASVAPRAAAIGAVDEAAPSLAAALKGADLVVISTPVGATPSVLADAARAAAL